MIPSVLSVTTNAGQLQARMRRRAAALELEQRAAATALADEMTRASRQQLSSEVYSKPVKRDRSGRPKWRRTFRLLRAEHWEAQGTDLKHVNGAPHYARRVRYGKPGGQEPAEPAQGIWQGPGAVALKFRRRIYARRQEALRRALRRG